jgi:hypothetical protein
MEQNNEEKIKVMVRARPLNKVELQAGFNKYIPTFYYKLYLC